ncbi:MAG: HNH endonuclease [Proteobacteria bacterium]|nr:HNH endonuclease [Pseudomonadota bacterium]
MKITLNCGSEMLIDAEDYQKVSHLSLRYVRSRYSHGSVRGYDKQLGKSVAVHRVIMAAPKGVEVDHINRNPLDNRRQNLRLCDRQQNTRNRTYTKASDLPKGVFRRRKDRSYRAMITIDGKQVALGSYDSPIQAALAYDHAAQKHFGEFARLNFDPERDWILPKLIPTKRSHSPIALTLKGCA